MHFLKPQEQTGLFIDGTHNPEVLESWVAFNTGARVNHFIDAYASAPDSTTRILLLEGALEASDFDHENIAKTAAAIVLCEDEEEILEVQQYAPSLSFFDDDDLDRTGLVTAQTIVDGTAKTETKFLIFGTDVLVLNAIGYARIAKANERNLQIRAREKSFTDFVTHTGLAAA